MDLASNKSSLNLACQPNVETPRYHHEIFTTSSPSAVVQPGSFVSTNQTPSPRPTQPITHQAIPLQMYDPRRTKGPKTTKKSHPLLRPSSPPSRKSTDHPPVASWHLRARALPLSSTIPGRLGDPPTGRDDDVQLPGRCWGLLRLHQSAALLVRRPARKGYPSRSRVWHPTRLHGYQLSRVPATVGRTGGNASTRVVYGFTSASRINL